MIVVLDTSAVIAVVLNEPQKPRLIERTRGTELIAPHSLPAEVGNALAAMFRRRRIVLDAAIRGFASYQQIDVRLTAIDMNRSLQLCNELGIYAYDAYMLDCALRHRCHLATLDSRLASAAGQVGVAILDIEP